MALTEVERLIVAVAMESGTAGTHNIQELMRDLAGRKAPPRPGDIAHVVALAGDLAEVNKGAKRVHLAAGIWPMLANFYFARLPDGEDAEFMEWTTAPNSTWRTFKTGVEAAAVDGDAERLARQVYGARLHLQLRLGQRREGKEPSP